MISVWKNSKNCLWVTYDHFFVSQPKKSNYSKNCESNYFLEKAKYEQLPKKDLNRLADYVELPERGLQVRCNVSDYALAEIWWKV